jgi:hypothetical protein
VRFIFTAPFDVPGKRRQDELLVVAAGPEQWCDAVDQVLYNSMIRIF